MKRFIVPTQENRCEAATILTDKSGCQCMRRKVVGDYCRQHARMKPVKKNEFGANLFSKTALETAGPTEGSGNR